MLPLPLSKKNKTSHLGINHCNVTETNHPALGSICLYCDGPFRSMELQWTLDRYGFKPSRKISNQPTYRWLFFFGISNTIWFTRRSFKVLPDCMDSTSSLWNPVYFVLL